MTEKVRYDAIFSLHVNAPNYISLHVILAQSPYDMYGDCANIGKLSITAESHISEIDLSRKWHKYGSFFDLLTQKGSPVAHSP